MKKPRKAGRLLLKEISFLEALLRRCPNDVEMLKALGHLYTEAGKFEAGLQTDLALSRLRPQEALVWYNLACSYALLSQSTEAMSALEQAVKLGYRDYAALRQDSDLVSLQKDCRFKELLRRIVAEFPNPV